jgi:flavin-binding protein dodecin
MRFTTQRTPGELKGGDMAASSGSVYDVIEVIGTSTESWEQAAVVAVETAAKTLRDLRIAEVVEMDLQIDDGKVRAFRTKVKLSFKYETKS